MGAVKGAVGGLKTSESAAGTFRLSMKPVAIGV